MSRTVRISFFDAARRAGRLAAVGLVVFAVPTLAVPQSAARAAAAGPVALGAAASYSVLTPAAVDNTVSAPGAHHTTLRGDLGAGGAVTGFPPGVVTGITRSGPDISGALADLATAYADAAGRSPSIALAGDLIGATLHAGVHNNAGAVANTGTVTLDGQGNPNGVFIFQVGGALGMAAQSKVVLANGAQASRVFWQVNGAATVGAGATMAGTVMAHDAIGIGAGALVNGRMLARTGAVALNDNDFFSNPPVVTITGGINATTNTATPTIVGTTDIVAPTTVAVDVAGQVFAASVVDGAWSVSPTALANGVYVVTASAPDAAGNVGQATQSLTVDTVLPIVTIDGGGALLTNDSTPTISGVTDVTPDSMVTVTVAGQPSTALVQGDGSWNITPAPLADGTRTVVASVVDGAGNPASATQSLTIDTTPALVTITGGSDALTNDSTPTIAGSADVVDGGPVVLVVEGQTSTSVATGGTWSVTAAALADGVHFITVSAVDSAGNTTHAAQSLTVDTVDPIVTIVGGATSGTNDHTPTSRGTADVAPGSLVVVTIAGHVLTTLVQLDGTWNVTPLPLPAGTYAVVASVTDPAGNGGAATQTLTVDTDAPVVTNAGGGATTTTDPTPSISGTTSATPGSIVTVTIAGQVLTTTVQADGSWSVTPTALPDGTYTVIVSVTDANGSTNTAIQMLTVDTGSHEPPDFTPVGPVRVFDTRPGHRPEVIRSVAEHKIAGATELEVRMTDLAGLVPADGVGAVSLNITATNSELNGYVTVYSCGTRALVSSLNVAAGKNVANAVVTPVSASGTVCFYSNVPTDIIVDVNGWFPAGGAFSSVGPERVFDTREGLSPDALRHVNTVPIAGGTMIEVALTDLAGLVPATGVGTVSLNVTATNPIGSGYITVYSCSTRELVSSVNFVKDQTVANAVLAPVSATGTVCFYASVTTDLVVDINGWLPTNSGFTGLNPRRVLDTRLAQSPNALREVAKRRVGGTYVLEVKVTDLADIVPATGVAAVSLNVTAVDPDGAGYVTVFPCGARKLVSSLNYGTGETVANAVLAPVSPTGTICLYSQVEADLVVDINGWFATPTLLSSPPNSSQTTNWAG